MTVVNEEFRPVRSIITGLICEALNIFNMIQTFAGTGMGNIQTCIFL